MKNIYFFSKKRLAGQTLKLVQWRLSWLILQEKRIKKATQFVTKSRPKFGAEILFVKIESETGTPLAMNPKFQGFNRSNGECGGGGKRKINNVEIFVSRPRPEK